MKKTFSFKKTTITPLIVLMILSSVTPLDIGNNLNISGDKIILKKYDILNYNGSVFSTDEQSIANIYDIEPILNKNNNFNKIFSNAFVEGPWPMYCHDARHTSRSPYSTADNIGVEKWRFDTIVDCFGSPIIDDQEVIYIGGLAGLFAVHPNGTMKWAFWPKEVIVSAPAIDDNGILYFSGIWGENLHAVYSDNGTEKWRYPIGYTWASPTVSPDGIIYAPATDNWNVIAFYPNGTIKWGFHANERVFSSPAIGDDGTVYCTSYGSYLYALYPENGTVKWQYHTGGSVRTSACVADDGTVYVVSINGVLHALYPNGTLKWQASIDGGTSPTIAQDGTIYCGYHQLYAVNPDGSMKWVFNPGNIGSIKEGTPCNSVDGTIYFGTYASNGGELIAVNSDGTERWRIFLATGYIMSAPAIGSDGTVYVGSVNSGPPYGWGYLHAIKNNPFAPSTPEISGPLVGKPDVALMFSFCSTSSVGKDLYYMIDWENGQTGWHGPYSSGETISLNHSWHVESDKIIRAWARDSDNNYSVPGEFSITIKPRNKAFDDSLLLRFLEGFPMLEKLLQILLHAFFYS